MLAQLMRRLLEVPALAVPVDDLVRRGAVRLRGDPRRAIREDLDITGEHQLDRPIDTAAGLRQLLVCLGGDLLPPPHARPRVAGLPKAGSATSSQLISETATIELTSI